MWRSLVEREISPENPDGRLGWLIVVATIPAGILGLLLQDKLQSVFASARSAAFFLILNGHHALRRRAAAAARARRARGRRRRRPPHRRAASAGGRRSASAPSQAIALIPGFSRSGASMGGGLLVGLSNEDAARFAFLLATPIIGAAAVLKIPVLLGSDGNGVRGPALAASLCSAVTAYLSVRFLMRYFETNRLTPFARVLLRRGHRALDLVRRQLRPRLDVRVLGGALALRPALEPGEGEAGEADQERRDAVLDVHGRDAALVPEEVRQRQRLGRHRPVHDGDGDEEDPGERCRRW